MGYSKIYVEDKNIFGNSLTAGPQDLDDRMVDLIASSVNDALDRNDPIGTVKYFCASSMPSEYLVMDASLVLKSSYPDLYAKIGDIYKITGETLPTGYFRLPKGTGISIRGWDYGSGTDPGRIFGSFQDDQSEFIGEIYSKDCQRGILNGSILIPSDSSWSSYIYTGRHSDGDTGVGLRFKTNNNETRVKNIALFPCIKALKVVVLSTYTATSSAGSASRASLADNSSQFGGKLPADYAQISQFTNTLSVSGIQYFPNGLIQQWGYIPTKVANITINFNIPFTTAVFNVQLTTYDSAGTYGYAPTIKNLTTSNVLVATGSTAFEGIYWFATGY